MFDSGLIFYSAPKKNLRNIFIRLEGVAIDFYRKLSMYISYTLNKMDRNGPISPIIINELTANEGQRRFILHIQTSV